ncbi:hypothetical protein Scep_013972 [Stephania cephalantha]|uniref:Uncharacterized protein n=1 Tax=Stephania cephalantha TaxID=152367 RepID=A0AAP0P2J2_9MAGN
MELVGRTVKKEFLGFGTVKSFDLTSGLFEIVYDGGDSEEMNIDEVVAALDGGGAAGEEAEGGVRRRGRPPKRRRRGGEGVSVGGLVKDFSGSVRDLETLDEKCGLSERVWRGGFDLNVSACVDDDDDDDDDVNWNGECKGIDSGGIAGETPKIKHSFDVNVSVHEESEETLVSKVSGIEGDVSGDGAFEFLKQSFDFGSVVGDGVLEDAGYGVGEGTRLAGMGVYSGSDTRLDAGNGEIKNEAMECNGGLSGGASNDVKGCTQLNMSISDMVDAENCGGISNSELSYKEEQGGRKRRRQSGSSKSTPQTALRRSSRRLSSVPCSANNVSSTGKATGNAGSSSPEMISASDEKSFGRRIEVVRKQTDLPPKLELPASSKNLNIDETLVLDIFSIYACLRSFSTVLFLSPFDLIAFVEAVKDSAPNSLIDWIHFTLLQSLKSHLEFLSNEGSEFASNCLRSLNWGFLDLVTWPLFMVEYLLISGSGSKPGFEKINLKLLIHNYYSQPPSIKIEILRCLCDDFLEGEAVRLELSRRTVASDLDIDLDRNTNVENSKKRKDYVDSGVGSCLTLDIVDEANDWNSDECCLCKMDGILICCDGCPAAYHTKCVGTAKELLPEGDWYCPECVMNRHNCWMKSPRALRGAELLGTDPYGRIYFSTCGYLLVLDSCDPDSSLYYYKRDDLDRVIEVLKSFNILYDGIIKAICSNWNIPVDSNGAKSCLASQVKILSREKDLNVYAHKNLSSLIMKPSEENEVQDVDKPDGTFVVTENVDSSQLCKVFVMADGYDLTTMNQPVEKEIHIGKLKGSTEIMEIVEDPNCERKGLETLNGADSDRKKKEKSEAAASVQISAIIDSDTGAAGKVQIDPSCYVNCYTFAQTAACVAKS